MQRTFVSLFEHRVTEWGHATAARHRENNTWESVSWREWWLESERFAAALIDVGVQPGDRVLISCQTRFAWLVAEMGTMMARAVVTAVFPNLSVEHFSHVLADCQPKVAILDGPAQLETLRACPNDVDHVVVLDRVSTFMEPDSQGRTLVQIEDVQDDTEFEFFDAFMAHGRRALARSTTDLASIRLSISPDDIATVVYTAGTTAERRGVALTHRNIVRQIDAIDALDLIREGETHLLSLPLAHIFARLMLWVSVSNSAETAIGTGLQTIVRDASEIQPHVIAAVPSMLEQFQKGVRRELRRFGSVRELLLDGIWTAGLELRVVDSWRKTIGSQLADNAIHRMFGERLRRFLTGGAKIDPHLAAFFDRIGVEVIEGYGLCETTGLVAIGRPENTPIGTVGYPLPVADVTLSEEGEIWVKGPTVAAGYFCPGGTPKSLANDEGWFQTGDVGQFDDKGRLQIIGRLHDEIVTSGGRKVSPKHVESLLRQSPDVRRALVIGNEKPFVVALLVTDDDDPETIERVGAHVQWVNDQIAKTATIRKFRCLQEPFSIERGELTSTGKLRRDAINRTRSHVIEQLYA